MTTKATATEHDEAARLRAEIKRTRAGLGGSVDALAAKLDVPSQVKAAAKSRAEPVQRAAESVAGAALGLVRGGVVAGIRAGISVARWTAGGVLGVGERALRGADGLRRRVIGAEPQPDAHDRPV